MSVQSIKERRSELIVTLNRVRDERFEDYQSRLVQYENMRGGGDGGPWREGADTSLRALHYKGWLDGDFQLVLEGIGETPILTEEEREEHFAYEKSAWAKFKKALKG